MFQKSHRATNVAQLFDDWTVLAGRGGVQVEKNSLTGHGGPCLVLAGQIYLPRAPI